MFAVIAAKAGLCHTVGYCRRGLNGLDVIQGAYSAQAHQRCIDPVLCIHCYGQCVIGPSSNMEWAAE